MCVCLYACLQKLKKHFLDSYANHLGIRIMSLYLLTLMDFYLFFIFYFFWLKILGLEVEKGFQILSLLYIYLFDTSIRTFGT